MSRAAGAGAGWRAPGPAPSDPGPQERIAARRRRMSARLDAKRRAALGEDAEPKAVEEEEQRRSHKEIEESGQELKNKDEQYVQAIKQQSDDINLLLERMEEQIRTMLKTYRHKLLQIELECIHTRLRKVEEFEKQLKQLLLQDEEEYNSMKIQLEIEVQNLEKQLQQMKAAYQLTQEKLDFNLQVLRKQDEENAIIRSQQKRKINRLYTIFSNLRTKLVKQEQQFREEGQSLATHCERIMAKCKVVQRKMRHFALSDSEKFTEVWLMNEEEAKGLMRKALDADFVIHTQQLGLHWEEPHYWFLNNVGPLGCYKAKRRATELAAQILTESSADGQEEEEREKEMEKVGSEGGGKENTMKAEDKVAPLRNICKKTAKRILELVSDESGFLLEGKQLRLLQALGRDDRILMKLDSIFGALGIDSEDDLHQLLDFFLHYKAREVTVRQGQSWKVLGKVALGEEVEGPMSSLLASLQSQGSPGGDVTDPAEDREHGGSSPQRDELKPPQSPPASLPSASIRTDDVLRILNAFMRDFNKPREKDKSPKDVLPERDSSRDEEYWAALAHVIPQPVLKLWDALAAALEEYYNVLTSRATLLAETSVLQQQNSELCVLLEEYVSSRVNSELLCPPTKWMDLSLACPREAQRAPKAKAEML
ncbi:hypothetical protein Q9966_012117 [Columba livia]|nr:hypothetical protein Q9966_012117 [Columba livia]